MPPNQHKHQQTSTPGLTPTPATAYTTAATRALDTDHDHDHDHAIIGLVVNILATDTNLTVDIHHGATPGSEHPDRPAVTITTPAGAHCATTAGTPTRGTRMCHDSGHNAYATMTIPVRAGHQPPTLTITTHLPVRDQSITAVSGAGTTTLTRTGWSPPGQTTITTTGQESPCITA